MMFELRALLSNLDVDCMKEPFLFVFATSMNVGLFN